MFSWREVFNIKFQGFIFGGILVNIFINDLSEEIDGMLIKFLDSIDLERRLKLRFKKILIG